MKEGFVSNFRGILGGGGFSDQKGHVSEAGAVNYVREAFYFRYISIIFSIIFDAKSYFRFLCAFSLQISVLNHIFRDHERKYRS